MSIMAVKLMILDRGYVALNREALDPRKHKNGDYKEYVYMEISHDSQPRLTIPNKSIQHRRVHKFWRTSTTIPKALNTISEADRLVPRRMSRYL